MLWPRLNHEVEGHDLLCDAAHRLFSAPPASAEPISHHQVASGKTCEGFRRQLTWMLPAPTRRRVFVHSAAAQQSRSSSSPWMLWKGGEVSSQCSGS